MKTTEVNKDNLLVRLKKNREIHVESYKDAMVVWEQRVSDRLHEVALAATGGNFDNVEFPINDLPKPISYVDSYDTAIARLEWEIDASVSLDEREFSNYVLDNWDWRNRFIANSSQYTVS